MAMTGITVSVTRGLGVRNSAQRGNVVVDLAQLQPQEFAQLWDGLQHQKVTAARRKDAATVGKVAQEQLRLVLALKRLLSASTPIKPGLHKDSKVTTPLWQVPDHTFVEVWKKLPEQERRTAALQIKEKVTGGLALPDPLFSELSDTLF